jgi:hypothetical protein
LAGSSSHFLSSLLLAPLLLRKLSAEIKSLLTDQDFIVEIEGFDLFMLMLNAKLEHSPLIDPDDVEESVCRDLCE